MAEIVNLRQARKRKSRDAREARAAENRVQFGRTKAERQQSKAEKTIQTKRLDQHKRAEDDEDN